jgi:plastocyanin
MLLGGLLLIGTPGAAFADRDRGSKNSHHESDDNDHSFEHRHFIFDRYFDWPEFYSYPFYGGYYGGCGGYYGGCGGYGGGYYGGPYYGDVPCGGGGYGYRSFYRFPFQPRCHYPGTPEPPSTCASAFSGCSYQGRGDQYGNAKPDMGMAPGSGAVVIRDLAFNPPKITTKVGEAVVWSFDDNGQAHTVTADDNSFDSGRMTSGEFRHTFDKPGTYAYHCQVHPDRMMGTVIVTG